MKKLWIVFILYRNNHWLLKENSSLKFKGEKFNNLMVLIKIINQAYIKRKIKNTQMNT